MSESGERTEAGDPVRMQACCSIYKSTTCCDCERPIRAARLNGQWYDLGQT